MVVAQKPMESVITEHDSFLVMRNLLSMAIFNISYLRGLFPEYYFNDKSVPAIDMEIKKLMPVDDESSRLIDWVEKGVFDALQKKYLRTLVFCITEAIGGPTVEEYAFSFTYSNSDSEEVLMKISCPANNKQGASFKSIVNTNITPNQMRSSACKMVRTLVQLTQTLDRIPEERTILMQLIYYEDVTPIDYEPPFFRGCSEQEANHLLSKNPLKVKSISEDPYQDENNDMEDDAEISLGVYSVQTIESSDEDREVSDSSKDGRYTGSPVGKDLLYMKALYHVLPMDYISISKLQSKLEGEANEATVHQLIDKMAREGFVEAKGNERLGKRVIQSDLTGKKLIEVKNALEIESLSSSLRSINTLKCKSLKGSTSAVVVARNGIVMGSDGLMSRWHEEHERYYEYFQHYDKVFSLSPKFSKRPKVPANPDRVVLAFAGDAEVVKDVAHELRMQIQDLEEHGRRRLTARQCAIEVEKVCKKSGFDKEDTLTADIIFGAYEHTIPYVFLGNKAGFMPIDDHHCCGSGSPYGEIILKVGYKADMDIEYAVRLVERAILAGARFDTETGGWSKVIVITPDGNVIPRPKTHVTDLAVRYYGRYWGEKLLGHKRKLSNIIWPANEKKTRKKRRRGNLCW